MKRMILSLLVLVGFGCDNFSIIVDGVNLNPSTVTLVLVNETEFPVTPSVFVSDLGDLIFDALTETVLTASENEQNFGDLDPQETVRRSYDCDDFEAVMAEDAEIRIAPGNSPEDSTQMFVEDRDFECGDTVTITYSGGQTDFNARISAGPG